MNINGITLNSGSSAAGVHVLTTPLSITVGSVNYAYLPLMAPTTLQTTTNNYAGRIMLAPFIPAQDIRVTGIQTEVFGSVAGTNARLLIYSDLNGIPDTLIIQSIDLSCAIGGVKQFNVSFTMTKGTVYWVGVQMSGTQTLRMIPLASMIPIGMNNASTNLVYNYFYSTAYVYGSAPTALRPTDLLPAGGIFPVFRIVTS